ncbi:MAG: DUF342 domain-containing protein [Leptospiraceae bacterium]|nr:DUF342 domain-containing protein [Leptospiraceae bacterium]
MEAAQENGPRREEVRVELNVQSDMIATVRLRGNPDPHFSETRIYQLLNEHNIKFGVDAPTIQKIVKQVQASTDPVHIEETVARGTPMTPGVNGTFHRLVRKVDKVKLTEDGKADFRNIQKFVTVEKGQPVVEIIPETQGKPGHNLYGEEIPAEPPEPAPRKPGKNISLMPGSHQYIARIHGVYVDDGKIIDISPELLVEGNAGLETGNIEYDGNVRILGNIERGTQVLVGGNLFVGGTVESGHLKVAGDMEVQQGINTARQGTLQCAGNIHSTYIENSVIICDGSIQVQKSILSSYVISHDDIILEKGGTLAGSEIVCYGDLITDHLGSKSGSVTRLFMGTHYKNTRQWEHSKKELEAIDEHIQTMTHHLKQYRDKVQRYRDHVPVSLQAEIRQEFRAYKEELAKQRRATSIFNYLSQHRSNPHPIKVVARQMIHPGVEIRYHGHTEKYTAETSLVELHFGPDDAKPQIKAFKGG